MHVDSTWPSDAVCLGKCSFSQIAEFGKNIFWGKRKLFQNCKDVKTENYPKICHYHNQFRTWKVFLPGSEFSFDALFYHNESIFYLGTTNFFGGSFFIKNHKNPSGGTPTCQKKWRFWSKTCFFRALNNLMTK